VGLFGWQLQTNKIKTRHKNLLMVWQKYIKNSEPLSGPHNLKKKKKPGGFPDFFTIPAGPRPYYSNMPNFSPN
jgi:hypothetical protein